jgi:carbonic anhydrase
MSQTNDQPQRQNLPAAEAIQLLIQGNARFIHGLKSITSFTTAKKTKELAQHGQKPFCIILTCSDSRIPIELIFDRGLGDLFVIRNFGNLVDPLVIASIEYAVLHFGIELILVMSHSWSGAIRMTMENEHNDTSNTLSPTLENVLKKVSPSLKKARLRQRSPHALEPRSQEWDLLFQETSYNNVLNSKAEIIGGSPLIGTAVKKKELFIVPSLYGIDTGRLSFDLGRELMSTIDKKHFQREAKNYERTATEILSDTCEKSLTKTFAR